MKYPTGIKAGSLVSIGDLRKGDVFEFTFGTEKLLNIRGHYEVKLAYGYNRIYARKRGTEEKVEIRETEDKTLFTVGRKYYPDKRETIPWKIKVIFIRKGR